MSSVNEIPNGWTETTLGEVCLVGDGAHSKVARIDKGILYLTAKNFSRGKLKLDKVDYISEKDYNRLFPKESKAVTRVIENDILMGIIGSFGNAYRYKEYDKFGISSSVAILRPKKEKLSSLYLEQYINGTFFRKIHKIYSSGSVQGYSNIPTIKAMPIIVPPLPEQKAIANILTAFDDKIENLQAQNKTLEQTAQTIFAAWFGKYQVGDELPDGWTFEKLETLADHIKDNIKPFNHPEKDYLHFSLPAYDNGLVPEIEKGATIKSNKYKVIDNSFLVSKLNPFTPRIWTIFNSGDNHICSTEFQVVKPKYDTEFSLVHCFLNSKKFTAELSQNIKGTSSSHQRVNPQDIFNINLILPNQNDLTKFNSLVYPIIKKKNINHNQIQSLKKTRDTLLPKLMSGQLRVKMSEL